MMEEQVFDCVMPYIRQDHLNSSVSLVSRKYFHIDSLTRKHLTVHVHYLTNPSRLSLRFPNLESLTLRSFSPEKCRVPVTPWIEQIAVQFKRLKSLSIRNMVVSPSDLKRLAETRGDTLRSLDIRRCKMFSEDGLVDVARYCVDLRSLRLDWNDIDDHSDGKWLHELALRNSVIESLYFDYPFDRYDMEDLTRLAKKCSNSLVSLNIFPKYLSLFREVFTHANKLHYFGHAYCDEDEDFSGIKFPSNICGLCIEDLPVTSFPFLVPYLNQLRELNIVYIDIEPICQCYLFKRCPSLEVLVTQDICGDEGLLVIGQFCKKLRKLAYRKGVTHLGLKSVAQGCPDLEYLEVALTDISNEALECVGTHLKNLCDFRIWLSKKDGITDSPLDNGVRAMLMGCSKLERLDIELCFGGLTDVGLGYIGKYGHNLRHLSLSCTGESDVGLLELSKGCPKLRKLSLCHCPFSEQAVATFVFSINQSLRYIRVKSDSHDDLVLTRPMVSAEDSLDCHKREKEARIVLEQERDSLKEELQRVRDYNSSLQQFNINLLNDLKSATNSNLQREREKSEILETSATDSFDEAFKENMMRCTVAEADKLSSMEETCSSQRDQISVLQHQLAAANHKLEASAVLNVDILTLLKFYFHEEFRKTAVSAVPDLLRFSKLAIEAQGSDGTYLKKLSDYIVPVFVEALHKEPDTKLIANMLDALSKCLQIFGPLLDENQVRSIVDEIKLVINASLSRKGKRTNTQDAELLKEEENEQVFYQVAEVVGTLAKSFKASFLPFFDELRSYLMPMLGKDKTAQERRIAICIFDDVAEQCREAALSKPDPFSVLQDDDQVENGDQEEESD